MLRRSITLVHASALVVGIIIGASIFVQPSVITGAVPTQRAVYMVWVVAGMLTLCGALIAAELSSAYPRAGGVYVFLREGWSPAVGFLWGWAMFWTMHTGIIAAIAMVFARYAAYFLPVGDLGMRLMAAGAILLLSAINCLGVRQGSLVQTWLTGAKLLAILAMVAIAFGVGTRFTPSAVPGDTLALSAASQPLTAHGFALAVVAGLFAFGGWHMATYAAEEMRDPSRTIWRALVLGVAVVTASYLALNAAYFHVLPPRAIASSSRVAADAADAVVGRGGAAAMSALVALSTFGALNGIILAGPRVYLAMARDGLLWRWFADTHPTFHTPHRALGAQAVWATVLVAAGSYRVLFTRVVYTEWIFFAAMALAMMRLRRRPGYTPAVRAPGYPVIPLLFVVAALYIVANQLAAQPRESLIGILFVGAGWPIYLLSLRRPFVPGVPRAD